MLSCKAVQKCLAVCLLHKEINIEQQGKQLERSSGLTRGKSTTEVYIGSLLYTHMITCAQKMHKNTISCLRTIRKNKDDLANTNDKYEAQYRGNSSDIHNGVGDQYL